MIPARTKLALYLCAALLCGGAGALWCHANDAASSSGRLELTLALDARGEVVATVHNGTGERKEFFTSPHRLEVFEGGIWRVPQNTGPRPRCGLRDVQQARIAPGQKAEFFVYECIDLVKPGQQVRVSICADASFATSWVTSTSLTLADPAKARQAESERLRAALAPR